MREVTSDIPPKRPPKPKNLQSPISEPLYITTLPEIALPKSPPKLKSILKNGSSSSSPSSVKGRSSSSPSIKTPYKDSSTPEKDVRHFNFDVKERGNIQIDEPNASTKLLQSPNRETKTVITENQVPSVRSESPKPKPELQVTSSMLEDTQFAARVESIAGILHLIVIICSIITLTAMSKLTNIWEIQIRRCPLYVETSKNTGVYWGNERMAPCHYAAYMPALLLVMSMSLIIFHGGILYSWRTGKQIIRLLLSRNYSKVMFFTEAIEMIIAISVASVIIDGVRQTCLSFQLNPWEDERPDNCKDGYNERDEVYGISKTYSKLITSMVASIISSFMLITSSTLYLIRINPCCRGMG